MRSSAKRHLCNVRVYKYDRTRYHCGVDDESLIAEKFEVRAGRG